jgi:hypothetical protein
VTAPGWTSSTRAEEIYIYPVPLGSLDQNAHLQSIEVHC